MLDMLAELRDDGVARARRSAGRFLRDGALQTAADTGSRTGQAYK